MKSFSDKLKTALDSNLPFALFRKPNESEVNLYVQDNSSLAKRFLFHSFDSKIEKVISDENPHKISVDEFHFDFELNLKNSPNFKPLRQQEYQDLIQNTIDAIQSDLIRKVVMSRKKVIENSDFNVLKSYKNLVNQHPSALVFLWHNPNQETWMGATPELLLSQENTEVKTVSLASTKLPENEWSAKEYDEQQIVTDFILNCFSDVQNVEVKGPKTVQAGKFQHLKSYISGEIPSNYSMKNLLRKLHPTPALCGMPKKEAFDYIVENEGYSRQFYSGYIGIENPEKKEYFVNLRSAQIFKDTIWIYVGGGITADSHPEKEWKETELKSGTILNALESEK
ncbi:MAG: chorismate-binding protein [Weeksellaceae bacterium]